MSKLLESRGYKVFMARVYGWGATVVLVGALFKLTHWPGANVMLTVGLLTEAIIFFFSAFEPPHVEPDWSLIFPEFTMMYHGVEGQGSTNFGGGAAQAKKSDSSAEMQKLDEMFEKAHVNQQTLDRLGEGINKLAQNASQMAEISGAVAATHGYTEAMQKATASVAALEVEIQSAKAVAETNERFNKAMASYIEKVSASADTTENLTREAYDLTKRMQALNNVYGAMLSAMNVKA